MGEFHTNSAEGFFTIFKRGMKGVYQHCSEKHLHRYLAEFDFRYSNRVRARRGRSGAGHRALRAPRASGSPIEQLVGSDPNQMRRRSRRQQQRAEQEAQLELFPSADLGHRPAK